VLEQGGNPSFPKYNLRDDLMVWTISDWSGGEGQIKLGWDTGNRHWRLNCVEVFEYPGKLMPGPHVELCVGSDGATPLAISAGLAAGAGKLWALDQNAAFMYEWDPANKKFKAGVANGGTYGACAGVGGHAKYVIFKENENDNIWKHTGTVATKINDDTSCTGPGTNVYRMGHYAYTYQQATGRVWEIDLEADSFPAQSVMLYDPKWDDPDNQILQGWSMACPGDNCLYTVMSWSSGLCVVSEITPTTAAGPGFGKEIMRVTGFIGESIWFHSGIIYVAGYEDTTNRYSRQVLYLMPSGEFGTLGPLRQDDNIDSVCGGPHAARTLDFGMCAAGATTAATKPTLFLTSAITGGQCVYGYASVYTGAANSRPQSICAFDGEYFFSTLKGVATKNIFRTVTGKYEAANAYAISSWHDFQMIDDKVLESIRLHTEAMPADWNVVLSYAVDGSTSFTTAGTYTTDGGTGTTYIVSTSAAPKVFRSLQLKVVFTYTGAGVPTTRPVVLAVEARASAAGSKGPTVWKLLLDCADDVSQEGSQSFSGYDKINNLLTAYALNVVELKDGYRSDIPAVYTTHQVVLDEYTLDIEKPGEGQALVTLREVT